MAEMASDRTKGFNIEVYGEKNSISNDHNLKTNLIKW